jgi:hypothetical protein
LPRIGFLDSGKGIKYGPSIFSIPNRYFMQALFCVRDSIKGLKKRLPRIISGLTCRKPIVALIQDRSENIKANEPFVFLRFKGF